MATPSDPAPVGAASDNPPSRKQTAEPGDLVQLDPTQDLNGFEGAILCVTEACSWGIIGFVQMPRGGQAFFRAEHGSYARTGGRSVWSPSLSGDAWERQAEVSGASAAAILPAEMTPAIEQVLGLPNFRTGPTAHLFRAAGASIRTHFEEEQAFVLFRFLHLALKHGEGWAREADRLVAEARATVDAKKAAEGNAP